MISGNDLRYQTETTKRETDNVIRLTVCAYKLWKASKIKSQDEKNS
jgi:hypothetical protein